MTKHASGKSGKLCAFMLAGLMSTSMLPVAAFAQGATDPEVEQEAVVQTVEGDDVDAIAVDDTQEAVQPEEAEVEEAYADEAQVVAAVPYAAPAANTKAYASSPVAPIQTRETVNVTKADIDSILEDGIKAVNAKMVKDGKAYAALDGSDLGASKITVDMYDGKYVILGSSNTGVYYDIINTLVDKLKAASGKVSKLKSNAQNNNELAISESSPTDSQVKAFAAALVGAKRGGGQDGSIEPTGGISQLDGKSYELEIVGKNDQSFKYTVKFEMALALNADNVTSGTVELDDKVDGVDGRALTGSALTSTDGKSGATVDSVKKLFSNSNSDIKICKADGTEVNDANAPVGTGYQVKSGNDVVTIIVPGDTLGNGKIEPLCAQKVLNYLAGKDTLTGPYKAAGQMRGKELQPLDAQMILNVAAGIGIK